MQQLEGEGRPSWKAKLGDRDPQELVNVDGADKMLHMTPAARAVRGRSLPCVRVGTRLQFKPSELAGLK